MKKLLRRILALLVILIVGFAVIFGYLVPRSTGDRYVQALQAGDSLGVRAVVCQDTPLSAAIGSASGMLAAVGITPGGEARNAAYMPLTGAYTFDWVIGGVVGLDVSTPVRLSIAATSPFAFCVREIALEG